MAGKKFEVADATASICLKLRKGRMTAEEGIATARALLSTVRGNMELRELRFVDGDEDDDDEGEDYEECGGVDFVLYVFALSIGRQDVE